MKDKYVANETLYELEVTKTDIRINNQSLGFNVSASFHITRAIREKILEELKIKSRKDKP